MLMPQHVLIIRSSSGGRQWVFLVRTQKTLEYSFQHMPVIYMLSHIKMYSSQPELNNNWTKIYERYKKKPKEKPNTPKKTNTDSTKFPLQVATQIS
jgi:hypothetical protein